ncbi:MAG: thioredoxin family protein [Candidatus Bathyarchaeia archaeon]
MKIDPLEIKQKTISVNQYLNNISEPFRDKFLERKREYTLNGEAVEKLKKFVSKYFVVAFSAEWCKDCAANIPILALLSETAGLEVRIFGGLKKDTLNPKNKWRIPPSPPEVETFNVNKIPHIIIFRTDGEEIGKIIEKPSDALTLEEEILQIVSRDQNTITTL